MPSSGLRLATITTEAFQQNGYVASLEGRDDCIVIDPGLEPERILAHLDREGLVPAAILNTHGHCDHIAGNAALKERWPACLLVIGTREVPKLSDPAANLSAMFGARLVSPPADVTVNDGDVFSAAGFDLTVYEIPGHSVGHVVYVWKNHAPQVAFVGDVIMAGSVGRTDFPDGDFRQLTEGIHAKLFNLPDGTLLYSGHGPPTTVGEEKRDNPFVGIDD